MTLDDLINEAAKGGRFCLTLWPTDTGYQANFSRDRQSWRVEHGPDAVTALAKVLGGKPAPVDMGLFD